LKDAKIDARHKRRYATPVSKGEQFIITITHASGKYEFDLSQVENQSGWTANFTGLGQAFTDIVSWATEAAML
jgi:phosphoribosylformylglycinamidine (FGAM) synthase-like amidotransferase family enzyme